MSGLAIQHDTSPLTSLQEFDAAVNRRYASGRSEAREARVATLLDIFNEAIEGNQRGVYRLREAITTAEFPSLFGDILDRAVMARFTAWVPPFQRFVQIGDFTDLTRNKVRRQQRGGNEELSEVGEMSPYPTRGVDFAEYEWSGKKYGADFSISWESMLADNLGELRNFPALLASAARISEGMFVTRLYVDANGPHTSFYTVGNGNVGTAPLSITALEAAFTAMAQFRDPGNADVPILNRPKYLVVPPALEITARGILESPTVAYAATAGSATPLPTVNIAGRLGLELIVDPNIPVIASSTNGDTSWFLFSEPNAGPLGPGLAALEFDRLRGFTAPLLLQKRAEFTSVGGGDDPRGPLDALDASTYRVVHAFGGARLIPQATYGSTGAGGGS